jgi:hypothetical protein
MYTADVGSFTGAEEAFESFAYLFGGIIIFYIALIVILILAAFVMYLIRGFAIYNMSNARGLQYGWLGFIPIASRYQLGQVAGEIEFGNKKVTNPGLWLVIVPIIYNVVFMIGYMIIVVPYVISLISLVDNPSPEAVFGPMTVFIIALFVFVFVMIFAQVFVYLFHYLVLHKIFSHYSTGQKPVFYMIIAMFVPLAHDILLFMHSKRPLLSAVTGPAPMVGVELEAV